MFQILEELLKKLEVEHVVWCNDKNGYYYQVSFPLILAEGLFHFVCVCVFVYVRVYVSIFTHMCI
jgi:hypothetical protein